jgi:IMP cyclohydrolase
MDGADYEPDSLSTPRISGVIADTPDKTATVYYLSIVTNGKPAQGWEVKPEPGAFYGVSTYTGDMEKPAAYDISKGPAVLPMEARTPQQIAAYVYDISAMEYQGDEYPRLQHRRVREGHGLADGDHQRPRVSTEDNRVKTRAGLL